MESLNSNKLLNRFLDWKITFILHCGNVLLKDLYKCVLKFRVNFPESGRTINNPSFRYCWYNLFRDVQFVQKHFDTLVNYIINRVALPFENTFQA